MLKFQVAILSDSDVKGLLACSNFPVFSSVQCFQTYLKLNTGFVRVKTHHIQLSLGLKMKKIKVMVSRWGWSKSTAASPWQPQDICRGGISLSSYRCVINIILFRDRHQGRIIYSTAHNEEMNTFPFGGNGAVCINQDVLWAALVCLCDRQSAGWNRVTNR